MHLTIEQIPSHLRSGIWANFIAPRPLALISTLGSDGVPNIAPYNSFTGLATNPPLLGVSFSLGEGGEKQTLANIKATEEFVINLVPRFLAEEMNTAAAKADHTDDFARLSLTRSVSESVSCPRIGESPASLECRLLQIVQLPPSRCELVIGQIVGIFVRDEFYTQEKGFDTLASDLLASVGAEDYISVNGELLHLPKTW